MKKFIFTLVILSIWNLLHSQEWQWAHGIGCPGSNTWESIDYLVKDKDHNVYAGMSLSSDGGGGIIYFNTGTYIVNGASDMFIIKYDGAGNELWVRQLGGNNPTYPVNYNEYITGFRFDTLNNILYITGIFFQLCNFGNGIVLQGSYQDIYIAAYNPDGNCLWAKRAGSNGDEYSSSVGTDEFGMLYASTSLTKAGQIDNLDYDYGGYLSKFSPDGVNFWTKKIFNNEYNTFPAVSIREIKSKNQLIYLCGDNSYSLFNIDTITVNNPGYSGDFLACLNSEGSALWIKQFGGPDIRTVSLSVTTDLNNNFYFSGGFGGGYATFGSDTIYSTAYYSDFFICKITDEGQMEWAIPGHSSNRASGNGLGADLNGKIYCSGSIYGSGLIGEFPLQSGSTDAVFLAVFNSSGNCLSADILADGYGGAVIAGNDMLTLSGSFLNTIVLGNITLTSLGYYDAFVAQRNTITGTPNPGNNTPQGLIIHVNPVTGVCTLAIPDELQHEPALTLLIFDGMGKLIQQRSLTPDQENLPLTLNAQAKGIYHAILTGGKKVYSGKIVFE